tara:strand:+ start:926 stop:1177 length:252 start_codon:yes stop_codon:yes gene_type:complete
MLRSCVGKCETPARAVFLKAKTVSCAHFLGKGTHDLAGLLEGFNFKDGGTEMYVQPTQVDVGCSYRSSYCFLGIAVGNSEAKF